MNRPLEPETVDQSDVAAARQRVERLAAERSVEFVHLQFIDIPGAIKGVSVPVERLGDCLENGVWFDGSSIEGFARLAETDLYLMPEPSSFALVPWERPTTARLLCNLVTPSGEPFAADPRFVLKRALDDAAELGYSYRVGAEVEFYLFEDRASERASDVTASRGRAGRAESHPLVPSDTRSYFELPDERAAAICQSAVKVLRSFGYNVAATHHEVSPGQHEIDLGEDDALRTADAIVTLKLVVRALAARSGLFPTFMPKPLEKASGSGVHLSQMLIERSSESNAFFDAHGEHQLSPTGRSFVAGQLAHARGMSAVLAPLVNSYKRLLGGDEAPAQVDWARLNRGAFIRLPEAAQASACVIEVRAPDPSCNPYLALAVLLQSGLDGIRSDTPLTAPAEPTTRAELTEDSTVDRLPSTLGEALEEIEWDMVVRSGLGQPVYERFAAAKEQEWLAYRHHISNWEIDTYLESA
jgi:glutamine synthetase